MCVVSNIKSPRNQILREEKRTTEWPFMHLREVSEDNAIMSGVKQLSTLNPPNKHVQIVATFLEADKDASASHKF